MAKTFSTKDYPEYPREPSPGSFEFNEIRYLRRYIGHKLAKEVLTTRFILNQLKEKNPGLVFPSDVEIRNYVDKEASWLSGIGEDDPENPNFDPDDE
jgi:hypothetical protein